MCRRYITISSISSVSAAVSVLDSATAIAIDLGELHEDNEKEASKDGTQTRAMEEVGVDTVLGRPAVLRVLDGGSHGARPGRRREQQRLAECRRRQERSLRVRPSVPPPTLAHC